MRFIDESDNGRLQIFDKSFSYLRTNLPVPDKSVLCLLPFSPSEFSLSPHLLICPADSRLKFLATANLSALVRSSAPWLSFKFLLGYDAYI